MRDMKVSREFSIFVQDVLDEWLPPRLRDARWLMRLPMKVVLGDHTRVFMGFKERAFQLSEEEFSDVYRQVGSVRVQGETDLNRACTREILRSLRGRTVLDAGCGGGYLVNLITRTHQTTGSDIVVTDQTRRRHPEVRFREANVESLPFSDDEFDTVVCTHTLEHVQDLQRAVAELRRVARQRLIIVVPRQRPYKYNFSLHIHFFPYAWSLTAQFGHRPGVTVKRLGDWFYQQDMAPVLSNE